MKDRFSPILRRIFLKYPHISQKIWLVYEKISSFKTASHLTANKFLMDFDATSRSQVRTLQGLARRKPLKVIAVRLISSISLRLNKKESFRTRFSFFNTIRLFYKLITKTGFGYVNNSRNSGTKYNIYDKLENEVKSDEENNEVCTKR